MRKRVRLERKKKKKKICIQQSVQVLYLTSLNLSTCLFLEWSKAETCARSCFFAPPLNLAFYSALNLQVFDYFLNLNTKLDIKHISGIQMAAESVTREVSMLEVAGSSSPLPVTNTQEILLALRDIYSPYNPSLFEGWKEILHQCDYPGITCLEGRVVGVIVRDVLKGTEGDQKAFPSVSYLIEQLLCEEDRMQSFIFTNANIQGKIPKKFPIDLSVRENGRLEGLRMFINLQTSIWWIFEEREYAYAYAITSRFKLKPY